MQDEWSARSDDMIATLRRTDERLKALVRESTERVLAGSGDRRAMDAAYAALNGLGGAAEGLDALRTALVADGLDDASIDHIEMLYLAAVVGV